MKKKRQNLKFSTMKVAHVLRKYNPTEWGGTESALKNLFEGLHQHQVSSVIFTPKNTAFILNDPLKEAGYPIKTFTAHLPVWGISSEKKQELISVGGNLLSFDLFWQLMREPHLSLIHTHTINRLGATALLAARLRGIPLVVTAHGGILDLPPNIQQQLIEPLKGGWEWGKIAGWMLGSRKLLARAQAILTCNHKEAELLQRKYPHQEIIVQPHAVSPTPYQTNCRTIAEQAFPSISNRQILLCVSRIDPVKNQAWLIKQMPQILKKHPNALLVLAGACTNHAYGKSIHALINALNLSNQVLLTGGFVPTDQRLVGLYQQAKVIISPSLTETFGLTILEAWAAGTPIIASSTSGAKELISEGKNGFLFDLEQPETFHNKLETVLCPSESLQACIQAGQQLIQDHYSPSIIGGQVKALYEKIGASP